MSAAVRRGRPTGALQPVLSDLVLGHHHFAFLRAAAEGIDVGKAAARYLVAADRLDPRTAKAMERALLERVIAAASALNDVEARQHAEALARPSEHVGAPTPAPALPSLDDFAAEFDADMYSEAELLELYQERYGGADSPRLGSASPSPLAARLEALDRLQGRLGKHACGGDPAALWLAADLAEALCASGVVTLNDLVTLANRHGKSWHRQVSGLGRVRAARVIAWLDQSVAQLRHPLHARVSGLASRAPAVASGTPVMQGLVPLERLDVPLGLDGAQGTLRCSGPNTYGAVDDLQAVRAWLVTLATSPLNTRIAYVRDIERFYIWCVLERRQALSSLTSEDLLAFHTFLRAPPASWVCSWPAERTSADWRPFRGALSARSATRTLATVGRLLSDLVRARYLVASPMPRAAIPSPVQMDVMRSFSRLALQALSDELPGLAAEGASGRRTLAIAVVLQTTGLRISELARARWCDLVDLRLESGGAAPSAVRVGLKVVGKGNKERIVPLREDAIAALVAHRRDVELGMDVESSELRSDPAPLVCSVADAPGRRVTPVRPTEPTALGPAGIHACLKRLFRRAAAHAGAAAEEVERASAHWWRHTFGHQVLKASGNQLPVVQQLLGHASINTTAIYVKVDFADRAAAVAALPSLTSANRGSSGA